MFWQSAIRNIFSVREVRRRIIFTLFVFAVFRFSSHLPLPGVDVTALRDLFNRFSFLGFFNLFSGGGLQNFSITALGLNPYINASIIMQLLTMAVPKFELLSKEGEYGREKINQYTRFLTLPLSIFQAYATYALFRSQGIVGNLDPYSLFVLVITLTAGTIFTMWLGELISEFGIGNGVSMVILAGIVSGIPISIGRSLSTLTEESTPTFLAVLALGAGLVGFVVLVNEAIRQIPVQYARRIRGGVTVQAPPSYLPIKVNSAGMIPILFAVSLIVIPTMLLKYVSESQVGPFQQFASRATDFLDPSSLIYNIIYFLLVFVFTYFYTAITFNPEKVAGEIKKHGGFIPGVRPGRPTADYLNWVLMRITMAGAVFLGTLAVSPSLFAGTTNVVALTLGGSGILIVVSVILETVRQVESLMVTRDYDIFLK